MRKAPIIVLVIAILFFVFKSQYKSTSGNAAYDLNSLDFEEFTDVEKLQTILNRGPSFNECAYKIAFIDPLPIGPTDAIISGYLYYSEEEYTNLTKSYSWNQYNEALYFDVNSLLCFSQDFTQKYAPVESSIRFFIVADSCTIYFEGIF